MAFRPVRQLGQQLLYVALIADKIIVNDKDAHASRFVEVRPTPPAVLALRLRVVATSLEVNADVRLLADYPRVMPWWN